MWSLIVFLTYFGCAFGQNQPVVPLPYGFNIHNTDNYLNNLNTDLRMGTDCNRPCLPFSNRVCYHSFHVENYQAMGAACGNCSQVREDCFKPQCVPTDGFEKGILTINRQIPGPLIQTCHNDLIVVDVYNHMISDTFTIHWHGILQMQTPYMDGVPKVTQCPIEPLSNFRYTFWASESGTFFYHSHSGLQRYNGAYGGLVIRTPNVQDLSARYFDEDLPEHTIVLSDWSHESSEMFFVGLPSRIPGLLPQALLVNGKGQFYNVTQFTTTPYETFYVESGKRYRFRIIDAGSTICPVQVQIENHKMTVIATDGSYIVPQTVDTLYLHTGERMDIVVTANESTTQMFWIHIRAVGLCTDYQIFQHAVLSYLPNSGDTGLIPSTERNTNGFELGTTLNHPELDCVEDDNNICIQDLKDPLSPDYWERTPDQKIFLTIGLRPMNTTKFFGLNRYVPFLNINDQSIFLGSMNGLSFMSPEYTLLTQGKHNNPKQFCNANKIPESCDLLDLCVCTHMISLKKNSIVEFIIVDESPSTFPVVHPIHFHGYRFSVLKQGRIVGNSSIIEIVRRMDATMQLQSTNPDPPLKDTICLQNQGYVVIRFEAINSGAWLVHCHVEDHMVYGMALVLIVDGAIPPPPHDFPKCSGLPY